jgi:hypothetical protein
METACQIRNEGPNIDVKEIYALFTDIIHVIAELLHSMPCRGDAIRLAGNVCMYNYIYI